MELGEVSQTLYNQQAELNKQLRTACENMQKVVALNSSNSERQELLDEVMSLGRAIGESVATRKAAVAAYASSGDSAAFEADLQCAVNAFPSQEDMQAALQKVDKILSEDQAHETPSDTSVEDESLSKGPKPEPPKRLTADPLNEFDDVLQEFTPAALRRALQIGQRADQLSQWADTRRWKSNLKETKRIFRDDQFSPRQMLRVPSSHPPSNMKGRSR